MAKRGIKPVGMSAGDYKVKHVSTGASFYKKLGAKHLKG